MRYLVAASCLALLLISARQALALPTAVIDFEHNPPLPLGAADFQSSGPEQDVNVPNLARVSGGVLLHQGVSDPIDPYLTAPNEYATASSYTGASPTLKSSLSITVAPVFQANEISFVLVTVIPGPYIANAFDGTSLVATQTINNNFSGTESPPFAPVDLKAPTITSVTITSVTITPPGTSAWNYAIDTVAFNENVRNAVMPSSSVPLPAGVWMGLGGLGVVVGAHGVRRGTRHRSA